MDIHVENLAFSYAAGKQVLQDISLTIQRGERAALIGHNGSGKTSLAKHFNGLLRPCSGAVSVGNQKTDRLSVARLSRMVALLFQNPDDQISRRRVWDEVAFGPKNLKYPKEHINRLVHHSLSLFDLLPEKDRNPYDLGYSERKRVALASTFAMDTPIMVLDEPTAGFDAYERSLLAAALDRLRQERKSALVITHDMDFVAERIERVICLENGKKLFDGPAREAFCDRSLLASCHLRQPQIVRLSAHFGFAEPALTPHDFLQTLGPKDRLRCRQ